MTVGSAAPNGAIGVPLSIRSGMLAGLITTVLPMTSGARSSSVEEDHCNDIVEQCIGALVEEQEAVAKDRDAARILDDTGTIDLAVIKISGETVDRICRGAIGEHRLDPIGQWVAMFRQGQERVAGPGVYPLHYNQR